MQPTAEEITARKKMYKEAASLGIDLMGYDSNDSAVKRRDRRKAVVLLGTGQSVPEKLKKRLIRKIFHKVERKRFLLRNADKLYCWFCKVVYAGRNALYDFQAA